MATIIKGTPTNQAGEAVVLDTNGKLPAVDGSLLTNVVASTATTATALSTASGSAPSYSARAWVNFNGTGTVAIRASGNVSSITDNGTGDYTVNFASPMIDANYCIVSGNSRGSGDTLGTNPNPTFQTISTLGFRSLIRGTDNGIFDQDAVYFAIFR